MISIIVPVYNTEKYLHRCIDSILAQTFTDFELLLINDGSKDNSGKICDEYAAKDSRVRVFHKENGGVSSARNMGLDNAKGEWVTFVDSDDWICNYFLENLIQNSHNTNLVLETSSNISAKCITYSNKEEITLFFERIDLRSITTPWGKLFKLDFLGTNNIRFKEDIHSGEDSIFMMDCLFRINTINTVNCSYYKYTETNGLSQKKLSYEDIDNILNTIISQIIQLENKYNIDLLKWKCNIALNFVTKYNTRKNIINLHSEITQIAKKSYIKILIENSNYIPKGKVRYIYDFLFKNKMSFLITFFVVLTKRFYN